MTDELDPFDERYSMPARFKARTKAPKKHKAPKVLSPKEQEIEDYLVLTGGGGISRFLEYFSLWLTKQPRWFATPVVTLLAGTFMAIVLTVAFAIMTLTCSGGMDLR